MASQTEYNDETLASDVAAAFPASIKDKVILITGVSPRGLGEATASALASHSPSHLILSGRSSSKVEAVISALRSEHPSIHYTFLEMDLSDFSSVREAASQINHDASIPHVDLLINNAGVMAIPERTLAECDQELHFATNHLGHFLFTNLIVQKLIVASTTSTTPTRIVNLSSYGHCFSPVRFSDTNFSKFCVSLPASEQPNLPLIRAVIGGDISPESLLYQPWVAYGQSKTANILFSAYLSLKLSPKYAIQSYAVHPGSINTELQRHIPASVLKEARERAKQVRVARKEKSLEQGASTTLVAALDPGLKNVETEERDSAGNRRTLAKNVYFADCQVANEQAQEYATDIALAEKLWELSEEIVGQKFAL